MSSPSFSPAARVMLVGAAFVVVVGGVKLAADLLIPLLLSVFIAMMVLPLQGWLKKRGVPSALAILLVLLLITLCGFLLAAVVGSSINDFRENLPFYTQRLKELSEGLQQWLAAKGANIDPNQLSTIFDPAMAMQFFGKTLASLGGVMSNALMILLTVLFILAEEVGFADKLRAATGTAEASQGVESFSTSLHNYMKIKTLISLATGLLILIGTWAMGLDYPALWGLLAFLLNFVPTVGSIIAAVPAVLLAIIQLGPLEAAIIGGIYVAANLIMGNAIEPRVMGRGLNLSTFVVFVSLVFWGWVLGPVGMLLSVPLTIMIKIALESSEDTRWLGVLLGAGVPSTEGTQIFVPQPTTALPDSDFENVPGDHDRSA